MDRMNRMGNETAVLFFLFHLSGFPEAGIPAEFLRAA
jgi:hypothetical protein